MTRSNLHLRAVFEAYEGMRESDDDKTLLGAIQSEFTGNEEKLLCTIVKYSLGTTDYFVDLLRECVEGVGTSERRLINTIVGRAEIAWQRSQAHTTINLKKIWLNELKVRLDLT